MSTIADSEKWSPRLDEVCDPIAQLNGRFDAIEKKLDSIEQQVTGLMIGLAVEKKEMIEAINRSMEEADNYNQLSVNFFFWSFAVSLTFLGLAIMLNLVAPETRYIYGTGYALGGIVLFFATNRFVKVLWDKKKKK
jgi:hypothetical protein